MSVKTVLDGRFAAPTLKPSVVTRYERSFDLAKRAVASLEARMAGQDKKLVQVERTLKPAEIQEARANEHEYPKRLFLEVIEYRRLSVCLEEQRAKMRLMQVLLGRYAQKQS